MNGPRRISRLDQGELITNPSLPELPTGTNDNPGMGAGSCENVRTGGMK